MPPVVPFNSAAYNIDALPSHKVKRFLINYGYNPNALQTRQGLAAAIQAYKKGVAPTTFNTQYVPWSMSNRREQGAVPGATMYFTRGDQQQGTGIPSIDEIMGMLGQGGSSGAPTFNAPAMPDFSKLFKGMAPPKFNAKSIKKLIRQSYKPIIDSLKLQLKTSAKQGEQNLADLEGWYGQVGRTAEANVSRDAAAAAAAKSSYDASVTGFANAVGGSASPAGPDIAKAGAAGAAGLAGIAEAQGNFDANLATLIGAQKADAFRAERGRASQEALTLMTQLNQVKSERRANIMKAIFEGKQQDYQNKLQFLQLKAGFTQRSFENAMQVAQLEFQAKAQFAQATDPAALLRAAIDIQYGLLRNQQAQQPDPSAELDFLLKQQQLARGEAELMGMGQEGSTSSSLSASQSGSVIKDIASSLLTTNESGATVPVVKRDKAIDRVREALSARGIDPYSAQGVRIMNEILTAIGYGSIGGGLGVGSN